MFVAAAMVGLVGSPHCSLMCGPLLASTQAPGSTGWTWHVGRLIAYAALGAAAGSIGVAMPGPGWLGYVAAALVVVWLTAVGLELLPMPQLPVVRWTSGLLRAARHSPAAAGALGAATVLLPCGVLWGGLAMAVAAGDAAHGAAVMLAFGVGAIPALAGLAAGWRAALDRLPSARRWLAAFVLLTSLGSIGWRGWAAAQAPPDSPPACH